MESVIAVSSVTYAMKGAALLKRNGIAAQTIRLEANQTRRGCAYGLKIAKNARQKAVSLLYREKIPYSEIIDHVDKKERTF